MKLTFLIALVACFVTFTVMGKYLTQERAQSYLVDKTLEKLLDQHSTELYDHIVKTYKKRRRHSHGVWTFEWLPGYLVKYDLARLDGLLKMKECIDRFKLDLLTLPKKRLYHFKHRPYDLSNKNYALIIEKIKPIDNPQPLSLEQVKQICILVRETQYIDAKRDNYFQVNEGKLCLFDTEGTFDPQKMLRGYTRMIVMSGDLSTAYSKKGLKHIFHELAQEIDKNPLEAKVFLRQLWQRLLKEQTPQEWNYLEYFKALFSQYLMEEN